MKAKLVSLDFTEHDTIEALKMLMDLAQKGEIIGMVFAAQTAKKRSRRVLLGATGRPANDVLLATGLTAVLQCSITQEAMQHVHNEEV